MLRYADAGPQVANLYFSYPILNKIASHFNVGFEEASRVPILMQSGYAAGLLLICPLGDLLRIRSLIVGLILVTATLW
jgi:hypothetical protein